ncbi:MAG: (Fe-S)-binding protein [Acidimicrobiia bacterium]
MAVQLFVTCLVDALRPEVGEATVAVLEAVGDEVEFPPAQTCCGQPAFNAGFTAEAADLAARTVRLLDATEGPIVLPSGSCTDFLVHHAPRLLADGPDAEAARRVAARCRELTQYLVDDRGAELTVEVDGPITYHPSCHGLRNLGIAAQPAALLAGCERAELAGGEREVCCGFGGLFSVELPQVSGAMLARKLDALEAVGPAVLCGGDVSCLLHLEGGLRRRGSEIRVAHLAELLAESL